MHLTQHQADIAIQKFKEKLRGRFGDSFKLYLFGSVARGDFGPESDVDVLVLLEQKADYATKDEIYGLAFDVMLECNVVVGPIVESKAEWASPLLQATPIHKEIDREGILL